MDYVLSFDEYRKRMDDGFETESGKCPVLEALHVFQGKWKLMIIYEIAVNNVMRFNEIKKRLEGISNTALSNALHDLEKDGILIKSEVDSKIPYTEYTLTSRGNDLIPIFYELTNWGLNHIP